MPMRPVRRLEREDEKPARRGKKKTVRLLLSSGLDCFSHQQSSRPCSLSELKAEPTGSLLI
jgi:hypothetical protein